MARTRYNEFKKGDLIIVKGLGSDEHDYITRVLEVFPNRRDHWLRYIKHIDEDGDENYSYYIYCKLLKRSDDLIAEQNNRIIIS